METTGVSMKYRVKIYNEERITFEFVIEKNSDFEVEEYLFNHPVWSDSVSSYAEEVA